MRESKAAPSCCCCRWMEEGSFPWTSMDKKAEGNLYMLADLEAGAP